MLRKQKSKTDTYEKIQHSACMRADKKKSLFENREPPVVKEDIIKLKLM